MSKTVFKFCNVSESFVTFDPAILASCWSDRLEKV